MSSSELCRLEPHRDPGRVDIIALEYYNAFVMRTTIELKEEHRALLHAIAARRGWRGYSKVIEEAIEFYLRHHSEAKDVRRALLDRRGAWRTEEAEKVREAIRELREKWIVPTGSS